jgi:acyl carrier protein
MERGERGSAERGRAMEAAAGAVEPESLWEMGERRGWGVRVRWSEEAGCVDLLVEKVTQASRPAFTSRKTFRPEGNNPLRARQERQMGVELKRYLEKRLPEYMIPVSYVVLESLPLTANGKVDRRSRPAPGRWKHEEASGKAAAASAEEEVLAGIWRSVLGVEEVGVEEDFFELGGHSLMATRVVSRIGRELGVEVGVRELFEAPTVRGLARRMWAPSGQPEKRLRSREWIVKESASYAQYCGF